MKPTNVRTCLYNFRYQCTQCTQAFGKGILILLTIINFKMGFYFKIGSLMGEFGVSSRILSLISVILILSLWASKENKKQISKKNFLKGEAYLKLGTVRPSRSSKSIALFVSLDMWELSYRFQTFMMIPTTVRYDFVRITTLLSLLESQ